MLLFACKWALQCEFVCASRPAGGIGSSGGCVLFPGSWCASGFFECWLLQVFWPPRTCPVLLLLFPCVAGGGVFVFFFYGYFWCVFVCLCVRVFRAYVFVCCSVCG